MKLIFKNSLILTLLLLYFYSPLFLVDVLNLKNLSYIYKVLLSIYASFVYSSFVIILFSGKNLNLFKIDDLNNKKIIVKNNYLEELKNKNENKNINKFTEKESITINELFNKIN